ncbi:flagellar export chaperone FliS [Aeromonas media]|uniref:flagellar export chaperone FliS n=1 Tax=Aeromonas media TaxID=651 RepID=UPI001F2DCE07|nr:flagellar export chaperone FliS [Aeromonas media]MCE9925257.1 flagellar export chaperone FliS [Aeromonas media]
MYHRNAHAYKAKSLQAELLVADPHRVIQLMMQSVLERLAQAKGAMERQDLAAKGEAVAKAQALLRGLQDSLDLKQGQVADDLYSLYEYMNERVWQAGRELTPALLDEVSGLMLTIKSAWDQIPEEAKQEGYQQRQQQGEL